MNDSAPQNPVDDMNEDRLRRLSRQDVSSSGYSQSYTKFVRSMRLILPAVAIFIMAVLFIWPSINDERIIPVKQTKEEVEQDARISKNEFTNPQFESADRKNRPYKITAIRAVQGEINENLIMLERPVGVMDLGDGKSVRVGSVAGAYRRDTERFFLKGDVDVFHSGGYSLKTEEAHVDLNNNLAWSELDVYGAGPEMNITAKGMKADGKTGEIIFSGPATLVLEKGMDGL